jgi:hypothetical protein
MPQVFGHPSLMHRNTRTNRNFLMEWCSRNQIGLTDLIQSIDDADIANGNHKQIILSVNDNAFDEFIQITPTNISAIIDANACSLCGVYLTRYEHTLLPNGVIDNLWQEVKYRCNVHGIHCHGLVTPSKQFRAMTRVEKLTEWKNTIQILV